MLWLLIRGQLKNAATVLAGFWLASVHEKAARLGLEESMEFLPKTLGLLGGGYRR